MNHEPAQESKSRDRSHLFTVRVWMEESSNAQYEWRGKLQCVLTGEIRYFREWSALLKFLQEMLPKDERKEVNSQGGDDAAP